MVLSRGQQDALGLVVLFQWGSILVDYGQF